MTQQWDFPVDEPVSLPAYRRRLDVALPAMVERLRAGISIRALASEYGVSRETIRRALARTGSVVATERPVEPAMPLRRVRANRLPGRGRSRTLAPDEVLALFARHQHGESIRALARATGVSHETIRRVPNDVTETGAKSATA